MQYILVLLAAVWVSGLLTAQDATAQQNSPWQLVCSDKSDAKTCRMTQSRSRTKVINGKLQNVGKVLALTVLYVNNKKTNKRTPYLSIQLPLGVSLIEGSVIRVDKNKEIKLPYLQCSNAGCDASIELNKKLLRSMLAGIDIKVGFKIWPSTGTSIVTAPLTGFTKSFRKLK
jgi:invasion protein IalB